MKGVSNMAFDKIGFQKKLRDLIGSGTQVEFAAKCGISRTNVFRMLSDDFTNPPSKTTLARIADSTGTNIDDLYILCGYAESPAKARKMHSFEERIRLSAMDMAEGFSALTKNARLYNSISDFLEEYSMFYSHEDCKFALSEIEEYEGVLHPGAENRVNAYAVFSDKVGSCFTYFVIYLAITKGGKYVILDTALDGASLMEAEFLTEKQAKKLGFNIDELSEKDLVYYYRESAEQRLLRSIFGESDESQEYPYTVVGFGFELPCANDRFDEFISKHRDSVAKESEKVLDYLEKKDCDAEEFFGDYKDPDTYETGFPAVVSNIIRHESGYPVGYYKSKDTVTGEVSNFIMIPNAIDTYEVDDLKSVFLKYAKELGIKTYGECIAFTSMCVEQSLRFNVED